MSNLNTFQLIGKLTGLPPSHALSGMRVVNDSKCYLVINENNEVMHIDYAPFSQWYYREEYEFFKSEDFNEKLTIIEEDYPEGLSYDMYSDDRFIIK